MEISQILTFVIDGEYYGINVKNVREVLQVQKITRVPGATENMLGIMNVRGSIVPILDLKNKMNGDFSTISDESAIILVELSDDYDLEIAGLLVGSVSGVIDFEESELEQVRLNNMAIETSYVRGIGKTGDTFTIMLDAQKVIGEEIPKEFSSKF